MLTRLSTWASALESFLFSGKARVFRYGEFDCCLFVADSIQAMTGTDVASNFRGRYHSRREALAGRSVKEIVEAVALEHSMPEVSMVHAMRGDMVAISRQGGRDLSLGIVSLSGRDILIAGKVGWGPVPIERGQRAWKV